MIQIKSKPKKKNIKKIKKFKAEGTVIATFPKEEKCSQCKWWKNFPDRCMIGGTPADGEYVCHNFVKYIIPIKRASITKELS